MPGLSWLWAMVTGGEADGDDTSDPRLDGLDVRTIDVYDQAAVKRTLDEAISDVRWGLAAVCGAEKCCSNAFHAK